MKQKKNFTEINQIMIIWPSTFVKQTYNIMNYWSDQCLTVAKESYTTGPNNTNSAEKTLPFQCYRKGSIN